MCIRDRLSIDVFPLDGVDPARMKHKENGNQADNLFYQMRQDGDKDVYKRQVGDGSDICAFYFLVDGKTGNQSHCASGKNNGQCV